MRQNQRDTTAATKFFEKAMRQNGEPEKVTMDKSGANKAAMDGINKERDIPMTLADAILDRIVHSSHRIELKGATLRDKKQDQ